MLPRGFQYLLLITALMASLIPPANANEVHIKISASDNLHAGFLADGVLLGTIYVSDQSMGCRLRMWNGSALHETVAGKYSLADKSSVGKVLRIRLVSDDWLPDTITGRGIITKGKIRNSTVYILSDGEQELISGEWKLEFLIENYLTMTEEEEKTKTDNACL